MVKQFFLPRGTLDILPNRVSFWQNIELKARKILEIYGYREIRTPIFEETALFKRSLGQTSDVVQKQMLSLETQKKDGLSLRPEGTAGVVRSYIEHSLDKKRSLNKLYYIGPMFRGERPQKGRLRQFHHIGVEAIGISNPFLDAEVIALSVDLLSQFGLKNFVLKINSLGSSEDKKALSGLLRKEIKKNIKDLCGDCQSRFERNIFRILDCKNDHCKKIVSRLKFKEAYLSAESEKYFSQVREALELLDVSYEVSPLLVRGLDYYTHTVFEISHSSLGSQDALGAGGRYDNLVKDLGGPSLGAVGFALGMERVLLVRSEKDPAQEKRMDVFVVTRGQEAYRKGFMLLKELRSKEICGDMSYTQTSFKSQMRMADKAQASYVILIGEDEVKEDRVTLKDMKTGYQLKLRREEIREVLQKKS